MYGFTLSWFLFFCCYCRTQTSQTVRYKKYHSQQILVTSGVPHQGDNLLTYLIIIILSFYKCLCYFSS